MASHEVVVQLIGATTTRAGLTVNAKLDKRQNPTNVKMMAEAIASVNLEPHAFHGEWKYTLSRPIHRTRTSIRCTFYWLTGPKAVLPGLILLHPAFVTSVLRYVTDGPASQGLLVSPFPLFS